MNTLGQRIRFARGNVSQDIFSVKISVSKGSLGGYERDENLPNTDVILKICSETGISVAWLMTGEGPMRPGEAAQTQEPQANAPETPPAAPEAAGTCARCAELKAELDEERRERRELSAENRQLWKENGVLREEVATLRERQKTCCPDPLFKTTQATPPNNDQLQA